MRMEREHDAVRELGGAGLDPPDGGVAVLHRERKCAAHERRAHALELARRHPAGKHQPLGAAADRAKERAHPDLAGRRRGDRLRRAVRRGRDRHTRAPWPSIALVIPHLRARSTCTSLRCPRYILAPTDMRKAIRMSESRLPGWRASPARKSPPTRPSVAGAGPVLRAGRADDGRADLARRVRAVAGRIRRRRSRSGGAVRGHAALVRDRLLERDHRAPDHALCARSGGRGHAGRPAGCAATSRSPRRPRSLLCIRNEPPERVAPPSRAADGRARRARRRRPLPCLRPERHQRPGDSPPPRTPRSPR